MSQINESAIKTPGVYVNEIPSFPPSVAQVATAIPAFIGYTETAVEKNGASLSMRGKRISSMVEYESYFGKAKTETIDVSIDGDITTSAFRIVTPITAPALAYRMHYAMQMYFANGGGPCYVISVDQGYTNAVAKGNDTTGLLGGLRALEKEDEPTIIVFPDAVQLNKTDYYDVMEAALTQCNKLGDRVTLLDVLKTGTQTDEENVEDFRDETMSEKDFVMYGAAYHPWLVTSINFSSVDANVTLTHTNFGTGDDLSAETLATIKATNSNIYNMIKAELQALYVTMPPSSAIAGIYARVDASRGVWKAPANVSVLSVVKPEKNYSDQEQENFNVDPTGGKSINLIRTFTGRGTLVWGSRTLAGNDNEWRYVPVRRFFNMVEESTRKATAQFVFEPNDANTWTKVRAMIENYLTVLWRQGALAGAKPEHAFFVKVGLGQTMTGIDILEGRMIVEIGMAAVRPAEFIILRFMHKMQES